jgi:hypothetical protein
MINYIRHDNEFYGIVKLISGEEIMGVMIATDEEETTVIYVSDPLCPTLTPIDKDGQQGLIAGFVKWMLWSDEEFYIINESDIVTIAPMSTEAIMMYKMWWRKENGETATDPNPVPANENMGLVGKVSEMRKKLEDQWKNSK